MLIGFVRTGENILTKLLLMRKNNAANSYENEYDFFYI